MAFDALFAIMIELCGIGLTVGTFAVLNRSRVEHGLDIRAFVVG